MDERDAERFVHVHERIRASEPSPLMYGFVKALVGPPSLFFFRSRAIGAENVPEGGPVIVAPNHFSHWDHFLIAIHLRRKVQFMAKSQLFGNPVLDRVFKYGGTFPVRRGQGDSAAMATTQAILDRGGLMLMYPEGGRSRSDRPKDQPKRGIGQIALESGASIVPTAIVGSERIRRWRRELLRGRLQKVTVQFGEPMSFPRIERPSKEQAQQAADEVMARIRSTYDSLQRALEEMPRRKVLRAARRGELPGATAPGQLGAGKTS